MKKLLVLVLLLPMFAWGQAFDGTWKINLSNAQLSQKPEQFQLKDGQYTCSTCVPKESVKADGTDQKVPGAKAFDTLAVKQVDDKTVQFTRKKDGKTVEESTDTVSADGKTLTFKFKDYPPQGDPVTGSGTTSRVGAAAPAGAHAITGSWKLDKVDTVSDNGLTFTYKASGDGLSMTSPTGESYDAKFDGKDYPVKNSRTNSMVTLKKVGPNHIIESFKEDGKVVFTNDETVNGSTMKIVSKDLRRGTTDNLTAQKQ
jgi:hypothetical protein